MFPVMATDIELTSSLYAIDVKSNDHLISIHFLLHHSPNVQAVHAIAKYCWRH